MTSTVRDNLPPTRIVGWDIGGVNTKVACLAGGAVAGAVSQPFEVRRDPAGLAQVLRELAARVGVGPADVHAVTMTAELARVFATKREGVAAVLDAVEAALPGAAVHVYGTDGQFRSPREARQVPLLVASANWMATASLVAQSHPDAILLDIGTTTTDIIPIVDGRVVSLGRTDPDRLANDELVYSGVLRTPVEAISPITASATQHFGVAAEAFALSGDVYLWLGDLAPADYTTPTPDGRPATREGAARRLRRAVCGDVETVDDETVSEIALDLARRQTVHIGWSVAQVRRRHPSIETIVVAGLGAFLAARVARSQELSVVSLADAHGDAAGRHAPAASVALLLAQHLGGLSLPAIERIAPAGATPHGRPSHAQPTAQRGGVDVVVKVGGGLLAHPRALDAVLHELHVAASHARVLVVPGGGPFADAVRAADRQVGLADDAAHWMAVLAMDQYALLLASRVAGATLIARASSLRVPDGQPFRLFIVAPYSWLRATDPLPHSWDVTSDSIAAWVAGQVGSRRLVLVKPPGSAADAADLVDPYFATVLPREVECRIVPADDLARLRAALS